MQIQDKVQDFETLFQVAIVGLCSRDLPQDLIVKKASDIAQLAVIEVERMRQEYSREEEKPKT